MAMAALASSAASLPYPCSYNCKEYRLIYRNPLLIPHLDTVRMECIEMLRVGTKLLHGSGSGKSIIVGYGSLPYTWRCLPQRWALCDRSRSARRWSENKFHHTMFTATSFFLLSSTILKPPCRLETKWLFTNGRMRIFPICTAENIPNMHCWHARVSHLQEFSSDLAPISMSPTDNGLTLARLVDLPTPFTPQNTMTYGRSSLFAWATSRRMSTRRRGVSSWNAYYLLYNSQSMTKVWLVSIWSSNRIFYSLTKWWLPEWVTPSLPPSPQNSHGRTYWSPAKNHLWAANVLDFKETGGRAFFLRKFPSEKSAKACWLG